MNVNPDVIVRDDLRRSDPITPPTPRCQRNQQSTLLYVQGAGIFRSNYKSARRASFSSFGAHSVSPVTFEETKYFISSQLGKGGNSIVYEGYLIKKGDQTKCALVVDITPEGTCSPTTKYESLDVAIRTQLIAIQCFWKTLRSSVKKLAPSIYHIGAIVIEKAEIPTARITLAMEVLNPLNFKAMTKGQKEKLCIEVRKAAELLKAKRILHRDIKPDNLMLRDDGSVVLIDWNEAVFLDDVERMNEAAFNALLGRLSASEAYCPLGYGDAFAKIKHSTLPFEERRRAFIMLEIEKEEHNIAETIREIHA